MKWLKAMRRGVSHVEDAILVTLLTLMIVLATGQVLLHQFNSGFAWIDPALKMMVMWLGLTGAVVASRTGRHITVDLLGRVVKGRLLFLIEFVTALFTTAIAALIAWHGARFVLMEMEGGDSGVAGLPSWVLELIIPIAFTLMALRHVFDAGSAGVALAKGKRVTAEPDTEAGA